MSVSITGDVNFDHWIKVVYQGSPEEQNRRYIYIYVCVYIYQLFVCLFIKELAYPIMEAGKLKFAVWTGRMESQDS